MNLYPPEMTSLNCLRCNLCRLIPGTDFEALAEELIVLNPSRVPAMDAPEFQTWAKAQDALVPLTIHCRKVGHKREARIWRRCPDADSASRWVESDSGSMRDWGGNRTGERSPFERAFLRATYPCAPKPFLVALHGRDWATLLHLGHLDGLMRLSGAIRAEMKRQAHIPRAARQKMGLAFSDEQSAYILARFEAGQNCASFDGVPPELVWPRRFGGNAPLEKQARLRAQNEAIKADIVAQVAARGPARTYDAIRRHPEYKKPDYYETHKAAQRERLKGHRKNNALSRPQTQRACL